MEKILENSNKRFGFIFLINSNVKPRKTAGDPYTFRDTGNF
jgi:hypothetical protein